MRAYYEDKWVTIYHGDCREILPGLNTNADLILTDPDYNSESIKYVNETKKLPPPEYERFCQEWFTLAHQVTANLVFTPGAHNMFLYPQPRWILIWYKSSSPTKSKIGGFNVWEPVYFYGDMKCKFGHDVMRYEPLNFIRDEWATKHPCPKNPDFWVMLLSKIKANSVVDPFFGVGTTGISCKKLQRHCIGIEIEERYCEIAARRCSQEVMELAIAQNA